MRELLYSLALVAGLAAWTLPLAAALYQEEAGVVDWHFRAVGPVQRMWPDPASSRVIVLGDVLAAMRPDSGALRK